MGQPELPPPDLDARGEVRGIISLCLDSTAETAFRAAASSRTGPHLEARYRRDQDGAHRWHLVRALPLLDAAGSILRW